VWIRALTLLIRRLVFSSVKIRGFDSRPLEGPALVVASHFGGFADPLLLLSQLAAPPRFLAKSTLWDAPWLAPLLNRLHAIPIYRAQDGATGSNDDTFKAATEALRAQQQVAIFPEGFANDDPDLHPLKTGAARLALDAHAAGVRHIQIVPFCAQYERKTRMRTRVTLEQGTALDLDTLVAALALEDPRATFGSGDHAAVRALTERIAKQLQAIAPPAASETWKPRRATPIHFTVSVTLLAVALVACVYNVIPWLVVAVGRALRNAPVKEVTINVFVAPVVFPVAWLLWGFVGALLGESAWVTLAMLLAGPLTGVLTLIWWDGVRSLRSPARRP